MTVWLVKVFTSHVQGNGDDDVTFNHTDVHSVWTTEARANQEADTVRKTWKGNNVTWLDDVEVESHEVKE